MRFKLDEFQVEDRIIYYTLHYMIGEAVIMDNQSGISSGLHKFATFAMRILKIYIMTQMILNIENPDIIPSLRKVLGQIKGVTVEKTIKAEASEDSKEAVLESIATAYKEVTEARRTGQKVTVS